VAGGYRAAQSSEGGAAATRRPRAGGSWPRPGHRYRSSAPWAPLTQSAHPPSVAAPPPQKKMRSLQARTSRMALGRIRACAASRSAASSTTVVSVWAEAGPTARATAARLASSTRALRSAPTYPWHRSASRCSSAAVARQGTRWSSRCRMSRRSAAEGIPASLWWSCGAYRAAAAEGTDQSRVPGRSGPAGARLGRARRAGWSLRARRRGCPAQCQRRPAGSGGWSRCGARGRTWCRRGWGTAHQSHQ
jgi:hypothetical protein